MASFSNRFRYRSILTGGPWKYRYTDPSGLRQGEVQYKLSEQIVDSSNPGYRNALGRVNVGGGMQLQRVGISSGFSCGRVAVYNGGGDGVAGYVLGTPSDPTAVNMSTADLWSYGAKAIKQSSPTNPAFSLPTFLGELREGLPKMVGSTFARDKTNLARGLGGEYLNVEFGWKPFIQDLKDAGRTVYESSKIREQYIRDSGRSIHRRWSGPQSQSTQIISGGGVIWVGAVGVDAPGTKTYEVSDSIWFEGAFRYFIPTSNSVDDRWRRYNLLGRRMMGLSLGSAPETVWNLAPWSWLVDWHADVGDVISNIGGLGTDGLQLNYGYLMHQSLVKVVQVNTSSGVGGFPKGLRAGFTRVNESKQRVAASPFGFGLREVDYSQRQLAILGALGISRS